MRSRIERAGLVVDRRSSFLEVQAYSANLGSASDRSLLQKDAHLTRALLLTSAFTLEKDCAPRDVTLERFSL